MFTVKTTYDLEALTVMARALRKTLRKGHSILTRIVTSAFIAALLFVVIGFFLIGEADENLAVLAFDVGVIVLLLLIMLKEDLLNGWIAGKQMLLGARDGETTFEADSYTITTAAVTSTWTYGQIMSICETEEYIVFFLSKKHGQIFNKRGLQDGDWQDFRNFIMEKTGKPIQNIK